MANGNEVVKSSIPYNQFTDADDDDDGPSYIVLQPPYHHQAQHQELPPGPPPPYSGGNLQQLPSATELQLADARSVQVEMPNNNESFVGHIVFSIVVIMFCCLPFGVVGLIYAGHHSLVEMLHLLTLYHV